jgi:DNA-binding NarL/FixJ family response regulator
MTTTLAKSFTGISMQPGVAGEQLYKRRPDCGYPIMNSSPTFTKIIRVLIADDHPAVREGLAAILRSAKDIEVVAEATDGAEVCRLYDQLSPDVLMLDLRMPKKGGLQVVTELMSRHDPKPRIIVMATYEDEDDIPRTLSAGARDYVLKAAPVRQIRQAVRTVALGESRSSDRSDLLRSSSYGASAKAGEVAP